MFWRINMMDLEGLLVESYNMLLMILRKRVFLLLGPAPQRLGCWGMKQVWTTNVVLLISCEPGTLLITMLPYLRALDYQRICLFLVRKLDSFHFSTTRHARHFRIFFWKVKVSGIPCTFRHPSAILIFGYILLTGWICLWVERHLSCSSGYYHSILQTTESIIFAERISWPVGWIRT